MIKANVITQNYLEEASNGPSDLSARIKSLDVTKSFLVNAPAGSGKTELLSQRYLALLSIVNEPEEILAITFTNKSGNEMRSRIINALLKAENQSEPTEAHERLSWQLARNALDQSNCKGWDILNNPNRLRIKTIDAFYGSLARRAPMAGLIAGEMKIPDNYKSCYIKAARDLLSELELDNDWTNSLEIVLSHVDNRFDRAEELLVSLLERREQWLPVVLSARNTDDLRDKLEDTLRIIVNDIISSIKLGFNGIEESLIKLSSFAAANLDIKKSNELLSLNVISETGALPGNSSKDIPAWTALSHLFLTKDGSLRKSPTAAIGFPAPSSTKDKDTKAHLTAKKNEFKSFIEALSNDELALESLDKLRMLPPTAYLDCEWEVLQHLLMLLPILAAKLLIVFQREGVVDHSEIAAAALRVLGDSDAPTDLALILDAQLKHILIDEFQDTNDLQMKGLSLITSGWESDDGRSLFLVGDPRQSIYSFRASNVGLFLDVANNGFGDLDITPIELTVNFRSQKNVVNWVNSTFSKVFPSKQNSNLGSIPYSHSVPFLPEIVNKQAVNIVGFKGNPKISRESEGKWLADEIAHLRECDNNETIAVLVRNRSHLQETVTALNALEIPYQAIDIDPLKDRPIIRDLSSLTRALCHLGDRTAWLALLRSPLCGLDLADLEVVASKDSKSLIWENMNDTNLVCSVKSASRDNLNRLVNVIRDSIRWRERKSLSNIIEGAWLSLLGPSSIEDASDLENVQAYFKVLENFSYTSFCNESFEQSLKTLYAKPNAHDFNPVFVMTLHKSKGLQFDNVFIPGCERQGRSDDSSLLAWDRYTTENGHHLPLLSPSPEIGGGENTLYQFINKQGASRTNLERDRILYVGCTRAKKHLYLTCCLSENELGETMAPTKRSFMGALWPAVNNQVKIIDVNYDFSEDSNNKLIKIDQPKRVSLKANVPALPTDDLLREFRGRMGVNNIDLPDLSWKADFSAQVGQLFHRILRRICLDGSQQWSLNKILGTQQAWGHQLLQLGIPKILESTILNQITDCLKLVLSDATAQWILTNTHTSSACEISISSIDSKGKLITSIIDRTFIDNGIRWIIDYKTAVPKYGESLVLFEERMIEEHRSQLNRYAAEMNKISDEPIKCALYLVATQTFVEVNHESLIQAA
tara:strand:+ start:27765 stop:31235 length:3471 start_codon:yes stop_codon:yes gene_type:complete